jgi:hypothetical protein
MTPPPAALVDVVLIEGRSDAVEMLQRMRTLAVAGTSLREVIRGDGVARDGNFDPDFHIRLEILPDPRSVRELKRLAARLLVEPLDPNRPGWTLHYVERVARNRSALIIRRLAPYDERLLGALNGAPVETTARDESTRFDVSRLLVAAQKLLSQADPLNALIDRAAEVATRTMQEFDRHDASRSTLWVERSGIHQHQDLRIDRATISGAASHHGVDERSLLLACLVETASRMHESSPVDSLLAGIAVRRADVTVERRAIVSLPAAAMPFTERLHAIEEILLHLPHRHPPIGAEFNEWVPPALAQMLGDRLHHTVDLGCVFGEPLGDLSAIGVQHHTVLPMVCSPGAAVSMIAAVEGSHVRLGFTVDQAAGITVEAVRSEYEWSLRTHLGWDDDRSRISRWWATLTKRSTTA